MINRRFVLSVVLLLLASAVGVCYGAENSDDQTASQDRQNSDLLSAVENGALDDVKKLLDCGADVNAKNELGRTPVHLAVHRGDLKLVQLLAQRGGDVNAKDNEGRTPALFAVHFDKSTA